MRNQMFESNTEYIILDHTLFKSITAGNIMAVLHPIGAVLSFCSNFELFQARDLQNGLSSVQRDSS